MALDKGKIKELLGSGLSNEIVASAVGCDSSYIGQLMSDATFAQEVVELRTLSLTANSSRDRNIDSIENKLISKLDALVDTGMLYKPREILQAFMIVNNAKRRGVPAHQSLQINQTIVALSMPRTVVNNFTLNAQKEVVEIEADSKRQTLVTMPATELLKQLATRSKDNGRKYQELSRFLPAAHLQPTSPETGSGS